jgi:hypothetical protein
MSGTIRQEDAIHATKEEKRGKIAALGPSRVPRLVQPSLHSACMSGTWSSSVAVAVGLPSTSAGSSVFVSSPVAVCSTLSSTDCWARLPVLQLQVPWALRLGLSPAVIGLLTQSPNSTWESVEGAHPYSYHEDQSCQLHHSQRDSYR